MPVLVPRAGWRTRVAAHHNLERRIRRIRREILVGINVDVRGMIDRQQPHLIEVDGLFQRLHEAEAESLRPAFHPVVILSRSL